MSSAHVQHMHKALERLNLKIHTVISSITGYSGLAMVQAILAGERDPVRLVQRCDQQILQSKRERLLKALEGNWQEEHLFALKLAWQAWGFYQEQIECCDQAMGQLITQMAQSKPSPNLGPAKEMRNNAPKNLPQLQRQLAQIYGADLTRIPALNKYTVMVLLSEVGWDMSRWPTMKQFTAWLGVAPAHTQSGQRQRRQKRHMGQAGRVFCLAAYSMATAKKSWLSSFYRRIRALRGPAVALKATARKLAQLFYLVLTKGWDYVEQGVAAYEAQQRQMQMRRLNRLAHQLGMCVIPKTA
jgi:transposase